MTLHFQNPTGGPDVTRNNNRSILYVTTDPTADFEGDLAGEAAVDGSIRITFHPDDINAHIEAKTNGVWNDTGFRFNASSVQIGRDMTLSAVAGFLETSNPSSVIGHEDSLIPHAEFNINGTGQPGTPILKPFQSFLVYTDAVSQLVSTTIGIDLGVIPARIVSESIHEIGSVSATSDIQVSFYTGTDNTGFLFNRRNLAASDMAADTTLSINYDHDLGFEGGVAVFMEFTSSANISLKTDAGGNPLTTHTGHELGVLDLVTENRVFDQAVTEVLTTDLNPVYANQFE
jgi:hypothetical protein